MTSSFLNQLVARFEGLEVTLNNLDAATGDGDHGTTILRGLRAAETSCGSSAKAFRMAAGGASGSLFALLINAIEEVSLEKIPLGEALAKAADQISQLGQAKAGDKTMLDALIPAAEAALADLENPTAAAIKAAQDGAALTKAMSAKRGRAKYVENAGVGHIDAGAKSVAEILTALEPNSRSCA